MRLFKDKFGRNIRLTDERLGHILEHPELSNPIDKITETLMSPFVVMKNEDDHYVWLYYRPYKSNGEKSFLLVMIKISNGEGFLITAFYVRNLQNGEVVWKA